MVLLVRRWHSTYIAGELGIRVLVYEKQVENLKVDLGSQISSLKVEKRKLRSELNALEVTLDETKQQLSEALGGADALEVVANGMRRMEDKVAEQLAEFGKLQLQSETQGAECRRLKADVESLTEQCDRHEDDKREQQKEWEKK